MVVVFLVYQLMYYAHFLNMAMDRSTYKVGCGKTSVASGEKDFFDIKY